MKNTFDDVVIAHSTRKAETILQNQFYVAVLRVLGTREPWPWRNWASCTAKAEPTAPGISWSTSAGVQHWTSSMPLSTELIARRAAVCSATARGPLRLMSAGFSMMSAVIAWIGSQIINDVKTFVRAFQALFGGFRQRATATFQLLSSRTAVLVVATPQLTRCARRPSWTGFPRKTCPSRAW